MSDEVHGKYAAYKRGCRCEACVNWNRERCRRNKAARFESGRINHGKVSGYNDGCRCDRLREECEIELDYAPFHRDGYCGRDVEPGQRGSCKHWDDELAMAAAVLAGAS